MGDGVGIEVVAHGEQEKLLERAQQIISQELVRLSNTQEVIIFGTAGGRMVARFFEKMALLESLPWRKIQFFMVDERMVPLHHKESNFREINEIFFEKLINKGWIVKEQLHPFIFDYQEKENALKSYYSQLTGVGGIFDLLLLSAGEDGHVASLFPDHASTICEDMGFIHVVDSPKPPPERMSASKSLLGKAQVAMLFFAGEGKRRALESFLDDRTSERECPAKLAKNIKRSYLFTDLLDGELYEK